MYRIFIVEDDPVITEALCAYMVKWGFEAKGVERFQDVIAEFATFDPQLVLMDITLPFYDGYHWCGEIRKISKAPIIFISSANESMNILMALNAGADDFISKPFDLGVMMAKVQAMLRRTYDFSQSAQPLFSHGELVFTPADGSVTIRGEKTELSKNESRILGVLLQHKGETVSRELLMNKLWETDSFVDDNTLTVNINRLRKRLEAAGIEDMIKTKKGLGYRIE
ncbi:MAG: response regulator transcription factor [Eubacteriales bacterium]|nr:response regulator transcription factor [Eubacteriales bacterium]